MTVGAGIERFGVVGFNHRLIPAHVRGAITFEEAWCDRLVTQLRKAGLADGLSFVSTCNRQEIVLSAAHPRFATELVRAQLKDLLVGTVDGEIPEPYRHTGEDAVRHVLRVSASLDSLVVGERQITQQLRRSFDTARAHGWMDKALNGLSRIAVENARAVHTQTAIGRESVGVFSLTHALLNEHTAGLARPRVAVAGLGEIGLKTARTLAADGRYDVILTSRRPRTDKELGSTLSRLPFVPLTELDALLPEIDALVLATGAATPLVDAQRLALARGQSTRPVIVVDLGIPPQAHVDCGTVPDTRLVNLDWFTTTGFGQQPQAKEALAHAHDIVEDGIRQVAAWTSVRRYSALFDACVTITEQVKGQALPQVIANELASLSPEQQRLVSSTMHKLLTAYSEDVFEALHTHLVDPPPQGEDKR